MRYFQFKKLVRDRIPEHMCSSGQTLAGLRRLDDEEFIKELRLKVVEEARELAGAADVEEMKEELADVRESLDSLQKALGMGNAEVRALRRRKLGKNGSFDGRFYIESVGVEEGSEWVAYYLQHSDRYPESGD